MGSGMRVLLLMLEGEEVVLLSSMAEVIQAQGQPPAHLHAQGGCAGGQGQGLWRC